MPTRPDLAEQHFRFSVPGSTDVSALFARPEIARSLLVLAHGAGAGMTHPFMQNLADELAAVGIATLRYQFPYMEQHRRVPDSPAVLTSTVRAAVQAATDLDPALPLFAGGKSLGGRMTSFAASQEPLSKVRGLVFFGFPLHPPNRPNRKRASHLENVSVPMLFLQGTRDALADLTLLRPICEKLGPLATLHIFESADHSFHVLKRSGKSDSEVVRELASTVANWCTQICE